MLAYTVPLLYHYWYHTTTTIPQRSCTIVSIYQNGIWSRVSFTFGGLNHSGMNDAIFDRIARRRGVDGLFDKRLLSLAVRTFGDGHFLPHRSFSFRLTSIALAIPIWSDRICYRAIIVSTDSVRTRTTKPKSVKHHPGHNALFSWIRRENILCAPYIGFVSACIAVTSLYIIHNNASKYHSENSCSLEFSIKWCCGPPWTANHKMWIPYEVHQLNAGRLRSSALHGRILG